MSDKQIENLLTNDSFVRWITGNASTAEIKYWESWISEDKEREKVVHQAEDLICMTGSDELLIPDIQAELKKFEASMREQKLQRIEKLDKMNRSRQSKFFFGAVAAAALIVLVVSISFYLTFNANSGDRLNEQQAVDKEFKTAYGEKKSFKLSDGSVIILNANSNLRFTSAVQSGQNIDVWLEGEAYFDITHPVGDKQRMFRVHTSDGMVEVLGTEFVVKASSAGTRAVLSEGKIRVEVGNDSPESDTTFVMRPDELAHFVSGSREIDLQTVNTSVFISWIEGEWHFDKTPITEVAQRIEDTYGIGVIIRTAELKQRLLSGSIKSTNLNILKKALSKILDEPVVQQADSTMVIGRTKQKQ